MSGPSDPERPAVRDYEYVDTDERFAEIVEDLASLGPDDVYAVDTEFHRERTYFPKLALVQLAWNDELTIIDPLAVDFSIFARVLDGDATAIMHAAGQDLEVMELTCGTVPSKMFDTQIAAGFVGMSSPSLANLHDAILGKKLPKGDRLTNWLQRPLRQDQLDYAASDVADLVELTEILQSRLADLGRESWAATECELHRAAARGAREPSEAWRRIREAKHLRGRSLGVVRSVAQWREERAARIDSPVRSIMPDLGVVSIAQRVPKSAKDFKGLRSVDSRHVSGKIVDEVLAAVERGVNEPPPEPASDRKAEVSRELRPAVTLVSAWISQLARDNQLDVTLLGTRADIEAFLREDDDARLAVGWRSAIAGDLISSLVGGSASLAFDGHGRLLLEARSYTPVLVEDTDL